MISVQQALEILRQYAPSTSVETVQIAEAAGRYLAEDIHAKIAHPSATLSNMDGYATASGERGEILSVIGESAAGQPFQGTLSDGQAVRIFTGAVLPDGADRVILQEDVIRANGEITTKRRTPCRANIRLMGSDFEAGQVLLVKGHRIRAADLALAASTGLKTLPVRRKLGIAIIETGDELIEVGARSDQGQTYAANGLMLSALAENWGANIVSHLRVKDDEAEFSSALASTSADIIITIGGASVGKYDLARKSAKASGFDIHYSGIALRPGKPGWFATKDGQCLLGLPGNPASAFVGAHLFLKPLLGLENKFVEVSLASKLDENGPRETYLRGRLTVKNGQLEVSAFEHQDSYRLLPQSRANALICIPPLGGPYKGGDNVEILSLKDNLAGL